MIVLEWFFLGLLCGFPLAGVYIAVYGDREINKTIRNIRKNRVRLQKMKLEITLRQLIYRGRDRGYVLNISAEPKKVEQ